MLKKISLGLTWFEFISLQSISFIRHGCFTRKGGVSSSPFNSLNVQFFPEELSSIEENRRRIQKVLKAPMPLVGLDQVHNVNIAVLEVPPKKNSIGQFDALITNVPNIPLMIKHADGQPCLLLDPKHKAIAAIHCGWRGNVQNIYEKVVHKMVKTYKTDPTTLIACIGPSLGPNHTEFNEWEKDFPQNLWPFRKKGLQSYPNTKANQNTIHKKSNLFNLWEISREQLIKTGIQKDAIEIANICSFDQKKLFFSFRRDGLTGRNATCIMLI